MVGIDDGAQDYSRSQARAEGRVRPFEHGRTLHPNFMRFCGWTGIFGILAAIVSNIWGSLIVPDHDWIADTISDLGAGPYEIIQDFGLYLYAAGIFAVALGSAHYYAGRIGWGVGVVCLAAVAAMVVVIGARNEYGDGDNEGVEIHNYVVVAMAILTVIAPFVMSAGLAVRSKRQAWIGRMLGIAFGVGGAIFWFSPTNMDGLIERILTLVGMAFMGLLILHLLTLARDIAAETGSGAEDRYQRTDE